MKHLKVFEDYIDKKIEIDIICRHYKIVNYTINADFSLDVSGYVNLVNNNLDKMPLVFNRIEGDFYCFDNKLISLVGCPKYVSGDFDCSKNMLTSLHSSPKYVGASFDCSDNQITSLEDCPDYVGNSFICSGNLITTLKNKPNHIGGNLYCDDNRINTLKDITLNDGSTLTIGGNPLPKDILDNHIRLEEIIALQDEFMIWNSDGSLNRHNFQELMKEIK